VGVGAAEHTMSCVYDEYRSADSVFEMPPVLRALLREDGTYVQKLVFGVENHTTRNPFFAVVLHSDSPDRTWKPVALRFQVSLCYELTDEFPLSEDRDEFDAFTTTMQGMLSHKVNLVPVNALGRCAGVYDMLLELCAPTIADTPNEFMCSMRRNDDSPIDLRRCLVMRSRIFERPRELWDSRVLDSQSTPCAQRSTWTSFFRDMARIRWYTAYAHAVLCVDAPESMDLYSVGKCKQHWIAMVSRAHVDQDGQRLLSAKISMLETVENTYQFGRT
jgi:hypothetical protein